MNRGPVAEISLSALRKNLSFVRETVGQRQVIAVVKADAYGHGAVDVSRTLEEAGVDYLAVAFVGEARQLRENGITARILVLFDRADFDDYHSLSLIPVLHDLKTAERLSSGATRQGVKLPVHVKVDTGMGRMGLPPGCLDKDLHAIASLPGLSIEGLMSHFAGADLEDRSSAEKQTEQFVRIRDRFINGTGIVPLCHMANSAAVLAMPEAHFDAVRPGLMLYGESPGVKHFGLSPVMTIKAMIAAIRQLPAGSPVSYGGTFVTSRETRVAVLPVGYADGYSRQFSNRAYVLVRGRRAPVIGRVCMDLTMADITDIGDACEGDEVVLLGSQGGDTVSAADLASLASTISYEVLLSLGGRARRVTVQ